LGYNDPCCKLSHMQCDTKDTKCDDKWHNQKITKMSDTFSCPAAPST
jgi:hypothetical protein